MTDASSDRCFDFVLGRLSEAELAAFEIALLESAQVRDDVVVSAMLVGLVREYACACARESFSSPEAAH